MEIDNSVGRQLRQERLRYQWSLADVAAKLRVKEAVLEAIETGLLVEKGGLSLESERLSLPHFSFVKGFVRSYATLLGLDGCELSRRFEEEVLYSDGLDVDLEDKDERNAIAPESRSPFLSFFVGSVRLPVAIAGGVLLLGLLLVEGGVLQDDPAIQDNYQEEGLHDSNYTREQSSSGEQSSLDSETVSLKEGQEKASRRNEEEDGTNEVAGDTEKTAVEETKADKIKVEGTKIEETKLEGVGEEAAKSVQQDEGAKVVSDQIEVQNSRIAIHAQESIDVVIYNEEDEYARLRLAEGQQQHVPEGRKYRMEIGRVESWRQVRFVVDGMEVGQGVEAPSSTQSPRLILDGYAIVSGNWEWVHE